MVYAGLVEIKCAPPGGLEPPTFRLTAERASRLRHGGLSVEAHEEGTKFVTLEKVVAIVCFDAILSTH